MRMSATQRRVSKRAGTAAAVKGAEKRRRKTARVPRKAKATDITSAAANDLLVAQFAEALGAQRPKIRRKTRSLVQALSGVSAVSAEMVSAIDFMPGARILPSYTGQPEVRGDGAAPAPCAKVHRRNRMRRLLASFGGWSAAVAMTALIVGATAAGVRTLAPHKSQTMASASTAQF